ncbi:DUF5615 family PIN-like protein [Solicola gregarius]|uniref:DUF5615 family PIN-like protein n=1 Tax=Solicola gregarius TaxID=2908642 RepID=A0AA46TJV8_9ACTN|nr:DUF5615 family PIN-like protein [Solicola gregarius]UYM06610.1 DUF5615 family PIN-like protein [Solicola gregarius]
MRFIVDAQLPPRLARFLDAAGHEGQHVADLPTGVTALDAEIAAHADTDDAVVVTKDADFRYSHAATGSPRRLLLVMTGNTSNAALIELFGRRLDELAAALTLADFVELHGELMVLHRRFHNES